MKLNVQLVDSFLFSIILINNSIYFNLKGIYIKNGSHSINDHGPDYRRADVVDSFDQI